MNDLARPHRHLLLRWEAALRQGPHLIWTLAIYMALLLNLPVFLRRYQHLVSGGSAVNALYQLALEVVLVVATCALILGLARLTGRFLFRVLLLLILLFSVLASYYMTFFKVVIGYGVVQAVLTTDIDLSKEAVGSGLLMWTAVLVVPWLWVFWRHRGQAMPVSWRKAWWAGLGRSVLHFGLALALVGVSYTLLNRAGQADRQGDAVLIKPAVLAAHSYVPSNWIAGLAMSLSNQVTQARNQSALKDPAKMFDYQNHHALDDTVVVLVIGESARSPNFGVLGYGRDTTPQLSQLAAGPQWAAFKAQSCNTSTKLSLQCMFVRPEAVAEQGLQAPVISEQPVFSVFKRLGFFIELFAMQSEVWFYNSVGADFYKIREVIAADPKNQGQASMDGLLLAEVAAALNSPRKGKRLIVLHTKGSHYLYTSRYPREFARYQPECAGIDASCTKEQLINSYDNSILYFDDFLVRLTGLLNNRKALVVYTSDHGESIAENVHFHATPKPLAPPEQREVPLIMWASPAFLLEKPLAKGFAALKGKAETSHQQAGFGASHDQLFDTLLGCLGIESDNGGVNPTRNLCH